MYQKSDLYRQLAALGVPRDRAVLIHSSLRAVGDVEGGGEALLDALVEYVTAEGGLCCFPTHTWHLIGRDVPTLDLSKAETCVGALTRLALEDGRGVRTLNPTHSMVVFGDRARAEAFVKDDLFVASGTDPKSCYGKICEQGGHILLVGVAHNRNTYLHCVSEMLGIPNRLTKEPRTVTVKRKNGEIVQSALHAHHTDYTVDISMRFPKYETAFRYHGAITDGFIGKQCA